MPKRSNTSNGSSFSEYIKIGFGAAIGSYALYIILLLVGLAFFVPGFIMVKQEQKKEKNDEEEHNQTRKIIGFVLMGIGVVCGLGFGGFTMLSLIGNEI